MAVCRSHDRALPEIPASASGVASTDDDDEEDEGHYDVISKSRRAAAAAGSSSNHRSQKPHFCHPYEIVAGDSDSTYAGIREELEAVISLRNSRGRTNNSNAAGVISDPLYAGIVDDSSTRTQTSSHAHASLPGIPPTYSAVITNPRVQQLHVGDHVLEPDGTVSVAVRGENGAESPLLPPRNGNVDNVDGVAVQGSIAMSAVVASTSNSGPNGSMHSDSIAHVQELQLLHNNASEDAMPVSGMLVLSLCFIDISLDLNQGTLAISIVAEKWVSKTKPSM